MYRTAQITEDRAMPGVPQGFEYGEFVAVEYVGRGAFGLFNFRCTNADGEVAVMNEGVLEHFVL